MGAKSEIYNALVADTSIAYYVGTNIYYNILPLNQDVSTFSLVYTARISETTHTLADRDIMNDYSFSIKIVGTSTINIELINTEVRRTMQDYSSTNVLDVMFDRYNDVFDNDNNLYTQSLDFTITYCN